MSDSVVSNNQRQPPPPRLWPGLDVFRAVAIALVMALHFPNRFDDPFNGLFQQLQLIGWAGVDLFFVLSGFLIAHLLFQECVAFETVNVKRFWIRRAFKIYPGLYLLIVVSALGILPPPQASARRAFAELFFLQNYLPHYWPHTWSLAVEEHFYVAIAILVVLFRAQIAQRWPFVVASLALGCLALRLSVAGPFHYETHLYPTHLRIDSLFIGTLVAYGYYFHRERWRNILAQHRIKILLIAGACVRLAFWGRLEDSRFVQTFGLLFLALGCAILMALTVFGIFSFVPPAMLGKIVCRIGQISYGIYLWHIPVVVWMDAQMPSIMGTAGGLTLYIGSSVALGFLTTAMIEEPLLRLRNRLFPRAVVVSPG